MKLLRIVTLLAGLMLAFAISAAAQVSGYTFTATSGTFTPIIPTATAVAADVDDGVSGSVPIGFTFNYDGVSYTNVYASSNGWMKLGAGVPGSSSASNNLATGTNRPIIAPLWDDLRVGTAVNNGLVTYTTTGIAGSRVFTMQWLNMRWNYQATGVTISFQANLYEGTNVVEFVYRQESGAYNAGTTGGASIGITSVATGSGNFLSLSNSGTSPTASSTTETNNITVKPATGQTYTFTPPPPSVFFSATTYSIAENGVNALITVTRAGSTAAVASVDVVTSDGTATTPGDYTGGTYTASFAIGASTTAVSIPITDDSVFESGESFNLALTNPIGVPLGTPSTATVTITDNEPALAFSAATYSVAENVAGGNLVVTVNRTGSTTTAVSVDVVTADGSATTPGDYTGGTYTASFAIGVSTATVSIPIIDDPVFEFGENFTITLQNAVGGGGIIAPSTATVSIVDNEQFPTGIYTVGNGVGDNYSSLTNNGGIFGAINGAGASGPITINITSDLTGELGTNQLNTIVGSPAVIIQPSGGATRQIIGTNSTTALVSFNGADNLTIDGLNTGGNSLLIKNTGTAPAVRFINDASTNILRNSTIESTSGSSTISISTGTTTGNDDIQIVGNIIRDRSDAAGVPVNAVNSTGTNLTGNTNTNILVNNNQIFNFTSTGFVVGNSENVTFTNNTVYQTAARTSNLTGVAVTSAIGTNLFSINTIRDMTTSGTANGMSISDARSTTVSRNNIYNFLSTSGSTNTLTGIIFNGGSGTTASLTVANNFVSLVPGFSNAQIVRGIVDFGFTGNTFTSYYNSVLVDGTATGATNSWACQRSFSAPTAFTFQNNLCFNNRTGGTGNHFAMGDQSAATGTFVANYNMYVGTGATAANFFDYGTISTGTPVSFTAWQTGPPTRDANSLQSNPGVGNYTVALTFVSQTDLHLKSTSPGIDNGIAVVSVLDDFDGTIRSVVGLAGGVPDIGGDEFVAPSAANASISGRVSTANGSGIRNAVVVVTGGSLTEPRYFRTGSFGYYRFDELEVGQTYVLTVNSKRFVFSNPNILVTLEDNVADANFEALPQ